MSHPSRAHLGWLFTVGLSLLFGTDALVTASLIYYLYTSRTASTSPVNNTLRWLGQYTMRTGIFNCAGALSALICWCIMSHNLIFLTIFWAIAKLYANSFFAVLNARASLRRRHSLALSDPLRQTTRLSTRTSGSIKLPRPRSITKSVSVPQFLDVRSFHSSATSSMTGTPTRPR
ncbi:hypothetical protein H2248_012222 [Termitomyces sp. 'cryptogamus']|nr:hypothetical protein H2248_012222 [Termitomyces sp. 'cryptogamus']